jgi:hypothetical protein
MDQATTGQVALVCAAGAADHTDTEVILRQNQKFSSTLHIAGTYGPPA